MLAAGIVAREIERMAADGVSADGLPRFVWTNGPVDPSTYTLTVLNAIAEQQRWRAQYEAANAATQRVDSCSALALTHRLLGLPTARSHPMTSQNPGRRSGSQG